MFKKYKLFLMGILVVLSMFSISCSTQSSKTTGIQASGNIQTQTENEISSKIAEVEKIAQSGQYLYAISKIKVIRSDYDFSQYPKLDKEIKDKQSEYEFKNYSMKCLDELKKRDFSSASSDLATIVKNCNQNKGAKEVYINILKEIENELNTTKQYNEYISKMLVYIAIAYPGNKNSLKQFYDLNQSYTNEKHEDFDESIKYAMYEVNKTNYSENIKKEPTIGMSKADVRNSTWGEPKKVNETITANSKHEQWVYSNNRYVYFENDVVTTIQK